MIVMSHVVEVKIEGERYIPLLTLKKDAAGTLDLTTIANRQSRVVIKIFLRNDSRRLLREIEVSNIPTDRAGVPVIKLQGMFAGRNLLTFKVVVNGRLRSRINIRMKDHSRRRNKLLFITILLLLGAGIIFSSWLWLSKRKVKEQPAAAVLPEAARQPKIDNTAHGQSAAPETEEKDESVTIEPLSTGPKAAEVRSVKPAASVGPADAVEPRAASVGPADTLEPPAGGKPVEALEPRATSVGPVDAVEPPAASIEPADAVVEPPAGGKPAGPTELKKSTGLTLPEDTIYFLPDSSSLTPAAEAKLRTLLPLLRENPELEIEISGYCAPMGSEQGRVKLSLERAWRVHDFLTASGWKPDITAKLNGAGSRNAVTRNPEMQHLNRRVEILIISAAD